ncbi:MAG: T9SS type A sorting domain-containing protein [Ignavibacteria bacterium]|nr:T9SS type A sorting domain-containing protein [Ignavibacteria bacterium]
MKRISLILFVLLAFSGHLLAQIGGYAVDLDGTDDYIDLPDGVYFDDNTYTIEAWVYLRDAGFQKRLIDFANGPSSNNVILSLRGTNEYPRFEIYNNNLFTSGVSGNTQIPLNQWTHIALACSSGYARMYMNGLLIGEVATSGLRAISRSSNFIGKSNWSGDGSANMKIDEFRFWKTGRTAEEIKRYMYKELTGSEDSLLVYYKMSNGLGTTVSDNKTGGTTDGNLVSGPVWKASGCFADPTHAIDFDGAEYISATLSTAIGSSFTEEVWIYPTDASLQYRGIIGYHPGSPPSRTPSIYTYGLNVHFGFGNGTTWYSELTTSNPLTMNRWNHIATTFDGTNYRLYVNGKEEMNYTGASGKTPVNTTDFRIGIVDNYFLGKVDEVRIWSVARSAQEIRDNMMRPLRGDETNLKAYYRFEEREGTTVYDLSSNAQNGTMVNMEPATDRVTSYAYNTWIGSESTAWTNSANWSLGTAPDNTQNAGAYKWNLGNELNFSGTPAVNNLLVSSGSAPVLGSALSIAGNFVLESDLNLNGQQISLGSTGYLVEGSGRLFGTTGSISASRTLSNITSENVAGLGALITSSANMGYTTISRGHFSRIAHGTGSVLRWYDITPTTNTGLNATLVFNYNSLELGSVTESKLVLFKSTNSGTDWTKMNGTVDVDNNKVTLTAIDAFSIWTAADSDNPLPVELVNFSASVTGIKVFLNWETKTEIMNAGFEVERKTPGSQWQKIAFIEGHYTTNSPKYYSFTDQPSVNGTVFYRLKQIDTDGSFEYSAEIKVEFGLPTEFALYQNFPNPFNPETVISYAMPVTGEVNISIYNALGERIITLADGVQEAGNYKVSFKAENLPSGLYFCRMTSGKFTSTRKMMLLR